LFLQALLEEGQFEAVGVVELQVADAHLEQLEALLDAQDAGVQEGHSVFELCVLHDEVGYAVVDADAPHLLVLQLALQLLDAAFLILLGGFARVDEQVESLCAAEFALEAGQLALDGGAGDLPELGDASANQLPALSPESTLETFELEGLLQLVHFGFKLLHFVFLLLKGGALLGASSEFSQRLLGLAESFYRLGYFSGMVLDLAHFGHFDGFDVFTGGQVVD